MTAVLAVFTAPFVLAVLAGAAAICWALRPRHAEPRTTYWYDDGTGSRQVTADDYHEIRARLVDEGRLRAPTHRLVVHPSHTATDAPRVPWTCTCGTGSGVGGSRADAMGQHAAHTERTPS